MGKPVGAPEEEKGERSSEAVCACVCVCVCVCAHARAHVCICAGPHDVHYCILPRTEQTPAE